MAYFSKIRCGRLFVGNDGNYASELTSTQTGYLSGVTAGTVTASKAVVVDANKDIATFRDVSTRDVLCRNIDSVSAAAMTVGASVATSLVLGAADITTRVNNILEVGNDADAGSLRIYPATTASGMFAITCSDQDGDTNGTLNLMAQSAARTINLPDPGATAYVAYLAAEADKSLINATPTEINKFCDESAKAVVDVTGSTLSATQATHAFKTVTLSRAAGVTVTLPEATGTGDVYKFVTAVAVTSNQNKIITADTTNADICGSAIIHDDDGATANTYLAEQSDGFDFIQSNGTTMGGASPYADEIVLTDVATDVWHCRAVLHCPAASNPADPFGST